MQSEKPGFGLVVFEDAFDSRSLSALDSVYTEAGPLPGRGTVGDAAIYAVGAHSQKLTAAPVRGGFPGRRGAAIAYDPVGGSPQDPRSWNTPAVIEDVTSPAWGAAQAWTTPAIVGSALTGKVYVAATNASAEGKVWAYDPRTATWTDALALTGVAAGASGRWASLVVDPDAPDGMERVIVTWSGQGGQYFSSANRIDPEGDYLYARAPWPVDIGSQPRIVAAPGGDWLALVGIQGQLASGDRGATWEVVDAVFDATYSDACPLPSGGFLVTGRTVGGDATVRLLASARGALSAVAETVFVSTAVSARVLCAADEAGVLYVLMQNDGILSLRLSFDGGVTWAAAVNPIIDQGGAAAANEARWYGLTAACGCLWLVGTGPTSSTATDGAIIVVRLGGWGTVEQGAPIEESQVKQEARFGFGGSSGSAYLPTDLPQNVGWNRVVGAGTQSLDEAEVRLRLTATQLQTDYYETGFVNLGASAGDSAVLRGLFKTSGSTPNADLAGALFQNGLFMTGTLDNATNLYQADLKIGPDGLRLQTPAGTSLGTAALDGTLWTHVLVFLHGTKVSAWYSQSTGPVLAWTRFVNRQNLTAAASSATRRASCTWGHKAAASVGTADLYTRFAGLAPGANVRYLVGVSEPDDSPAGDVLPFVFGRSVPGRPGSITIPELTVAGEDVGGVSAEGGPFAIRGSTFELFPEHTYPAEAAGPLSAPSPRRGWRATGTAETSFVWEYVQEEIPHVGSALALLALRARPAVWTLERDDGTDTGVWETVGTLDLRLPGGPFTYVRAGAVVRPAGTPRVSHYIAEGELVGGYVVDSTAGIAREIAANTGGYWTSDATKQRIALTLAGVLGSDPTSGTANLSIVSPRGLLVAYPAHDNARIRWRVRATSAQVTPNARYEAGILAPGRLVGVGGDPSWAWGVTHATSRRVTVAPDGSSSVRQLGPSARVLSYTWDGGLPAILVHSPDESAPVVCTGLPLATWQDAPWTLPALLDAARSGERPVVAVPRLPGGPVTILRRDAFVYGRLGGELSRAGLGGTEGVDEVQTIGTLTVTEIV